MIRGRELSSQHHIKITCLKQVHSISSFKSVISRETVAPVGCTGGFEATAVQQQLGHSQAFCGQEGGRGDMWGGGSLTTCGCSKPPAGLFVTQWGCGIDSEQN